MTLPELSDRALLEAVFAELKGLRADVAALRGRRRRDPVRDGKLVSAIASTFGARVFVVDDLLASRDRELRTVLDGVDARVLGAWLGRLRGTPMAGFILSREKRVGSGFLWSLTTHV